jgi:hypothetical protein
MDTRANIVQLSTLLSDFNNNVLGKCSYDSDRKQWLFDGQIMRNSLLREIQMVLSKMEKVADVGTSELGLRDE